MIEHYASGSMTIAGKTYTSNLKIINGRVIPDWWRTMGHQFAASDIQDILDAGPDTIIIGTGSAGLMKVMPELAELCRKKGITLVTARTGKAVEAFNALPAGSNAAAAFHLTC